MPVDVFINVIANITSNSDWSSTNEQAVKTACIEAIGGIDTVNDIATQYPGIGIGEDVRAYLPLTKMDDIEGIDSVDILIAVGIAAVIYFGVLVLLKGFGKEEVGFLKGIFKI